MIQINRKNIFKYVIFSAKLIILPTVPYIIVTYAFQIGLPFTILAISFAPLEFMMSSKTIFTNQIINLTWLIPQLIVNSLTIKLLNY